MREVFYYVSREKENDLCKNPSKYWEEQKSMELTNSNKDNVETKFMGIYTEDGIGVIVKINKDHFQSLDRAYQHGDGFSFMLSRPSFSELSDEYYIIGVSPFAKKNKVIEWYKNMEYRGRAISDYRIYSEIIEKSCYIITFIKWHCIRPIKPFIWGEIGFNIAFVEAGKGLRDKSVLVQDNPISDKERKRKYKRFNFENPKLEDKYLIFSSLDKRNLEESEKLNLNIFINSPCDKEENIFINANGKNIKKVVKLNKGENKISINIFNKYLKRGNNNIVLSIEDYKEEFEVYVYKLIEVLNTVTTVDEMDSISKDPFMKGSLMATRYYCENIMKTLHSAGYHDDFSTIRTKYDYLKSAIDYLKGGYNLFEKGKILRLAFKSKYDGSLQPYSIYIPKSYDKVKKHNLMIMLHGSGLDDRGAFNNKFDINIAEAEGMVIAAPNGRGEFNCYCSEAALADIRDLTKYLCKLFSAEKVILSGYSMGGYGALRVYDYCKDLFDGVAVFSGHYNMPNLFNVNNGIDYSIKDNMDKLKGVPIIFFHGVEDTTCTFSEMNEFLNKLTLVNDKVKLVYGETGHSPLNLNWYENYLEWLRKVEGKDIV